MQQVREQFARAQNSLAGGVSSSTRVNQALGHPLYFDRADGCRVWDLDGNEYLDLCCSHGAALLGHGNPAVSEAVQSVLQRGAACAYENELHSELAELLCRTVPCLERVRFTGSGTEATMHCIRLARACTGRTRLIRFEGNFHGYHDQVMWGTSDRLGDYAPPLSPQSSGVAPGLNEHLIQLPYNRPDLLRKAFDEHGSEIAAVICEPVYYNGGCILPQPEFLRVMRDATSEHGALLIFDEVLSAFRMCPGGAQEYLQVTPDLCTIGKAVGGGFPLSLFGGRAEYMEQLLPQGDCQHSGTYNAHPVVIAAGLAAVRQYTTPGFYEPIQTLGQTLQTGLTEIFARHHVTAHVQGLGARFGIFMGVSSEICDYEQAQQHDRDLMLRFIAAAIGHGVYFHDYGGGACHHGFCAAMSEADAGEALDRLDGAVATL